MKEYRKCVVQNGEERRDVFLPEEKANVGEKIVIKEPDESGLWEVVDLLRITGNKPSESSQG